MFNPNPMEKIVAELAQQRVAVLIRDINIIEEEIPKDNEYTVSVSQVQNIKEILCEVTRCVRILEGKCTEKDADWLLRGRLDKKVR